MRSVVFEDIITMMSCHVMGSIVFEDINNICSLGVNEKYLIFLYVTSVLPLPILGLYQACPQVLYSVKFTSSP